MRLAVMGLLLLPLGCRETAGPAVIDAGPPADAADTTADATGVDTATVVPGAGALCDDWRPDGLIGPGMLRSGRFRLCRAGLTCEIPGGQCGGPGSSVPGICIARPTACDENLAPVCGCDHKTYSNDCARQAAGVALASPGACPGAADGEPCGATWGACGPGLFCDPQAADCQRATAPDAFGFCRASVTTCPSDFHPVCGCDGKTYGNDCARVAAGVPKQQNGVCGIDCDGLSKQAGKLLEEAVASVVQCAVDADCKPIQTPFQCIGGCSGVVGNDAVKAAIATRSSTIEYLCKQFADAGCVLIPPPCPPPIGGPRCQQGKCVW